MHIIGIGGHPRRYFDSDDVQHLEHVQRAEPVHDDLRHLLGFSQLIFVVNFVCSLFRGKVAGRNPWHSNTLEWTAPSPPPHGNFETTPIVRRGPYEYSVPGVEEDLPAADGGASGRRAGAGPRRIDNATQTR